MIFFTIMRIRKSLYNGPSKNRASFFVSYIFFHNIEVYDLSYSEEVYAFWFR